MKRFINVILSVLGNALLAYAAFTAIRGWAMFVREIRSFVKSRRLSK